MFVFQFILQPKRCPQDIQLCIGIKVHFFVPLLQDHPEFNVLARQDNLKGGGDFKTLGRKPRSKHVVNVSPTCFEGCEIIQYVICSVHCC